MLKHLLDDNASRSGKAFTFFIQFLIVVSLVAFAVDSLPSLSPRAKLWLHYLEIGIVLVFTVEYVLRLWVSERKLAFVFSFFGLIDLLAILPFYISLGVDLRSLRSLRLFRLIRILKLARYNQAAQRFHQAFQIAKEEVVLFLCLTLVLLYLSAVGIYYFENPAQPQMFPSIFSGLWWAVATLTSVGYGDVYPVTVGGKIFTFFILLVGIGMVSVPSGLIASAFAQVRHWEEEQQNQPTRERDEDSP